MGNFNDTEPDDTYDDSRNMFLYDVINRRRRYVEPGDMIQFHRGRYEHWAIYVGNNRVIQVTVKGNGLEHIAVTLQTFGQQTAFAEVTEESYNKVLGRGEARINNFKDGQWPVLPPETIVQRARRSLGKRIEYHVLIDNCEHFVTGCRYARELSGQEEAFWSTATFGVYKCQ